jgi:biotin carboxylase
VLRIWFNRTYATNRKVIAMLRANPDGRPLHVIGTHADPDSPVLTACDVAEREPDLPAAEYVDWALTFAARHRVEVLVPRLHMAELAAAREDFAAVGTRLLCADADTVRLFADKPSAYTAAEALGVPVPPYRLVRDGAALRAAHEQFAELTEWVCCKPRSGVAGEGYRRLTTAPPLLADFAGKPSSRVRLDDLCRALDTADEPTELMVMPYLPGPEISMDVLATEDGALLAAVGRQRSERRRLLVDDGPGREVAETLTKAHRIAYLSNTQVRYWQAPGDAAPRPYLLEVNTRISGGLFQTALAGVNLPWAAVQLALGADVPPLQPRFGAAFTTDTEVVPLAPPGDGRSR